MKAYIGGDIMTRGSQLAREEECQKIDQSNLNIDYYSPARNKSINDKSSVTEEENNHLAEKICQADIDRLWNSDVTVMCPEQHAIGTMCETGVLYGWKYMADQLMRLIVDEMHNGLSDEDKVVAFDKIYKKLGEIYYKQNYFHYADIRTNHLNEKDWRRSFSINQMLYGMILYASKDKKLFDSFDDALAQLKEDFNND